MKLEKQKDNFKNHVAKFTDYGNIKILDFKEPKTSHYRIRFLFEEDYCRLHISGDLGELVATNYSNMTFEKFSDFVYNTGYFEDKIDCMSRKIYTYDEDKARKDLMELVAEYGVREEMAEEYDWEPESEAVDDVIDDILVDFESDSGIGSKGYDIADEFFPEFWELRDDIGKENTGILDLYMMAFELAMEQLEENNGKSTTNII